ncbi:MAG: outer membrane beta-barrel protein [Flavobacteriales bacterium]|nr:outer membrane beta-barrel protein [Flavobacteriales bacterium]
MLKKAGLLYLLSLLFISSVDAQKTTEFGFTVGRSYYIGELNPKTHWGKNTGSLNYGAVFRLNLNERYSLKASLIRTKLRANDQNVDLPFNGQRSASFESKLTEFSTSIEFNFLPYKLGDKKHFFSPYIFVGISYFDFDNSIEVNGFSPQPTDEAGGGEFAMPFGPGFKLNIHRKVSLAFEWGFRKTSTDLLDGLENRLNQDFETGKSYDNDWFVVSGFMLTYKLTRVGPCPVYNF